MAIGGGVPSTKGLPVVKNFANTAPTQTQTSAPPFVQSDDSSSYSIINARRVAAAAALLAASSGLFMPPMPPAAAAPIGIPIEMGGSQPQIRSVYYQARSEPPYVAPVVAVTPPPNGWLAPLSTSPTVKRVADTNWQLPYFTPNPVTLDEWQQPLSVAPKTASVKVGFAEAPYTTQQVTVTVTPFWQGPLETAPRPIKARADFGFVPYNTAQVTVTVVTGWQGPLEVAPRPARARAEFGSAPYNTTVTPSGWQAPLTTAAAVRRAATADYALPIYIAPGNNTVTIDKWQQPLSTPPKTATAQPGFGFVPFNTAQLVVAPATAIGIPIDMGGALLQLRSVYYQARSEPPYVVTVITPAPPPGWQQPLAGAPKTATAQAGFSFVPYNTPQITVAASFGWYQALSTAPPVAKVQVGFGFVPYNTAQVSAAFTAFGWQSSLETAPRPVKAKAGFAEVPYSTARVNVTAWQGPLATAVTVRRAATADYALPPYTVLAPTTVTLAWQQQLSGIPRKPKAPEGFVLVPFSRLAVTGTLNATEAPDTALFNGSVIVSGTLVTTEAPDTALFNGTVLGVISGTLVTTEEPDVLRFFGDSGLPVISGTLVATDNVDIANIHGRGPVSPPAKATSKWDYTWYMQEKMRKPTSYYD